MNYELGLLIVSWTLTGVLAITSVILAADRSMFRDERDEWKGRAEDHRQAANSAGERANRISNELALLKGAPTRRGKS